MKLIWVVLLAMIGVAGWWVGGQLSPQSLALVVGLLLGLGASVVFILLWITDHRRDDYRPDDYQSPPPRKQITEIHHYHHHVQEPAQVWRVAQEPAQIERGD